MTGTAILDKGSNHCVISKAKFTPSRFNEFVTPYASKCKGINSVADIVGRFKCKELVMGGENKVILKDVSFDVLDADCPTLIGQSLLGPIRNKHILYNYGNMTVTLTGWDEQHLTLDLARRYDPVTHFEQVALAAVAPEPGGGAVALPAEVAEPGEIDLAPPDKVTWARQTLKVELGDGDGGGQAEQMAELIYKCRKVFNENDESNFGKYPVRMAIPTEGAPISCRVRNIPIHYKTKVGEKLDKLLKLGIIENCPNTHGWLSPIMVVPKKDGDIRLVIDFKGSVNRRIKGAESFPAPSMDDIFQSMSSGHKYFSTCDLTSGYWQIELEPADRHKTAFSFGTKTFQFCRAPMGLLHSGNCFVRAVNVAIGSANIDPDLLKLYVDDALLSGKTFGEFLGAHYKFLTGLDNYNLRLKPSKCRFLQREVSFLGQTVSREGRRPDKDMVQGITGLLPPTNKSELRQLCGRLTFLREFLGSKCNQPIVAESFSSQMKPFYEATKNNAKFAWTPVMAESFEILKQRMSSAPIISHFDPQLPVVLATDASKLGVGAFLMQIARDGSTRCVGCKSRLFSDVESRWSVCEQECYGLLWGCETFAHFLKGKFFQVNTDHRSLQYLDTTTFANSKISRWQERLSKFQFCINWIPGDQNVVADLLSRPHGISIKEPGESKLKCKIFDVKSGDQRVYQVGIPSWVWPNLRKNAELKLCYVDPANPDQPSSQLVSESHRNETHQAVFAGRHGQVIGAVTSLLCMSYMVGEVPEQSGTESYVATPESPVFDLKRAQQNDPFIRRLIHSVKFNKPFVGDAVESHPWYAPIKKVRSRLAVEPGTGLLHLQHEECRTKLVVPLKSVPHFIKHAHSQLSHAGRERTEFALRGYYWPAKLDDIRAFVQSCTLCASRKGNYGSAPIKTGVVDKGKQFGDIIYVDFVSMRSECGQQKVLTLQDGFTRHLSAYSSARDTARDAASGIHKWFIDSGITPKKLSSDRGRHFDTELIKVLCETFNMRQCLHVSYNPRSTSTLERTHRVLRASLAMTSAETGQPWPKLLQQVILAYNSAPNRSTGTSPHYARYGYHPELAFTDPDRATSDNALGLGIQLAANIAEAQRAITLANEAADQAQLAKNDSKVTQKPLLVGDIVMLHRPQNRANQERLLPWGTRAKVLDANELLARVEFEDGGRIDWVHRDQCRKVPSRPDHLRSELDQVEPDCLAPIVNQSGGGDGQEAAQTTHSTTGRPRRETKAIDRFVPGQD